MKKNLLALALSFAAVTASNAQINNGGLPLSITSNDAANAARSVTSSVYKAPTLDKVKEDDARATLADPKPYRVGVLVPTDFSFPESGSMVTLASGKKIWRGQINIADAPALVLYYDQFHLPTGVNLYLTNANGKQILGAYTEQNNSEDGKFATQDVQGESVNVELDMEAFANVSDIKLHVNNAAYIYRGISDLKPFENDDNGTAAKPTLDEFAGSSAVCEINAICPQGANFAQQRKSVVRILMPLSGGYVGLCSGTLINNTLGDCTPYILTATHCESTNSKSDNTYAQFLFFFNFETPDCAGNSAAPNSQTMFGATFVSRASYDVNNSSIRGDFLLLKLKTKVPASYGAYFAGWNRGETNPNGVTYIGFHHPSGDEKKLATGTSLSPDGIFGNSGVTGTHWAMIYSVGGVEEGSSGSPLFDANGRFIGDLSGGESLQACPQQGPDSNGDTVVMSQHSLYSKISRNWQYPEGLGATDAQLKTWLDPSNVGVTTIDALAAAATCNAPVSPTAISNVNSILDDAIAIYPNPVSTGVVRMKVNLAKQSDLSVTFYDITGARKAVYNLKKVATGEYTFNVSAFANGTYLMKINTGDATTSKKVMVMN